MNASIRNGMKRRAVLQGAGFLALSFSLSVFPEARAQEAEKLPADLDHNKRLDTWIRIASDGKVTLQTGKVEIGQGVLTALAQICADELDVDLARLSVVSGDTAICPNEGATAGSMSMPEGGTSVRYASAEARAVLLGMAADQWNVPATELRVKDGTISHARTRKQTTYWALLDGKQLSRDAMGGVAPKPAAQHAYVGKSVPRRDLPAKFTGGAIYVQDLRLDGMLHGRVVRQPSYGATLQSADIAAVEKSPGIVKVVRDGNFLGVIADKEWRAIKAARALAASAVWQEHAQLPADPYDWLTHQKAQNIVARDEKRNGPPPAKVFESRYRRAYQMHAPIGPSCGVAHLDDDTLNIWTHSQSVFETSAAIAKMLRMPVDKVRARHMNGSGCYGHNAADDAVADAAVLAHALPGKPVRVQWSRYDEHMCEPYGSAMLTTLRAGVDDKGTILDWDFEIWSTPHGTRPGGNAGNLLAGRSLAEPFAMPVPVNGGPPNYAADRNGIPYYAFPGQTVTTHFVTEMPLHVSAMRGLGAYANVFSIESFMDELAHNYGADPVEFRLRHLDDPRAKAVVQAAAEGFGWTRYAKQANRGRGFAFARYKNLACYCAVVMDVAVNPQSKAIQILRVSLAADAGEIVNPDGLKNQLEGGVIQSLSWTTREAVRYDDKHILSRDWNTYPILTIKEAPIVDITLLGHPGAPLLGAGEASQGPTGAALANAVFDATGLRVRQTPITPDAIRAAVG